MQVYLFPESVRIQVDSVYPLAPVQDQYFVRKASFLKLYYYVQEIGLIPTLIKVISRWKERARNRKFMLVGQGRVLETSGGSFKSGDSVVFIAPNHAEYEAEVVVHESCVCLKAPQPSCAEEPSAWYTPLMGWSPYSGSPCPALEILHLKNRLLALWAQVQGKSNVVAPKAVEPFQKPSSLLDASSNLSAVLFGLGNYAKTCILPNLHRQIELVKIHEIDPAQFAFEKRGVMYDTSPWPRADERFDVVIVAGYHHTHAPIAIDALHKNSEVIIEKPLVTTRDDLNALLQAMQTSAGHVHACFQKRYHRFNELIRTDLQLKPGDPVAYYAIVYEEQLPALHWYRWPNSKGSVISNGCHWIDHFFFLNDYSAVRRYTVEKLHNGEAIITLTLENGGVLSLTLSHMGSPRIGMQEYVELRTSNTTIKIENSSRYRAENAAKILRRASENKYNAYRHMYRTISRRIVEKSNPEKGDTAWAIERVSSVILDLDEQMRAS